MCASRSHANTLHPKRLAMIDDNPNPIVDKFCIRRNEGYAQQYINLAIEARIHDWKKKLAYAGHTVVDVDSVTDEPVRGADGYQHVWVTLKAYTKE